MKTIPRVPHLAFYEKLACTEPSSELWRTTAAGLHTLRLVDAWCRGSRCGTRVSRRHVRAVANLVRATEGEVRARLLRIVDAIQSNELHAAETVARALLDHCCALRLEMEWQLAVDVSRTIAERFWKSIDHEILLEATVQWSLNLRLGGRFDEAEQLYLTVLHLAARFQSVRYSIRGRIGLVNVLLERGNFPAAQSRIDEIISETRLAADVGLQGILSRALHTRATVAHARGQFSESVVSAYEALALCDDAGERESILHDIAAAFVGLGRLSAARDAFILLRATALNHANRWSASINLMEIAAIEGRAKSFEAWRREVENQRLRPLHRAHFLCLAGEGYERLGQYERALEMYEEAVSAGEALCINEVIIRAEARAREVHAKKYLAAGVVVLPVCEGVEHVMEAVTELRAAAGIPAAADP